MSLVGDKLVVFGGFSKGEFINIVYTYDIIENSWRNNYKAENDNEILEEGGEVPIPSSPNISSSPEPRVNHSQVTINTSIVIYGGVDKDGNCFNDLWINNRMS
jgi:N-acetylneuraminic acid mutarotase